MPKIIVMRLSDLRTLVAERERIARLDEIKKAKVHGYTSHLKRRVAILTGKKKPMSRTKKKNRRLSNTIGVRTIPMSELTDFSDIEQYIARD